MIKKGDTIPGWLLARPKGSRGNINAKGKYSIIMDDDDYFVDNALQTIKQAINECKNYNKKYQHTCAKSADNYFNK